LLTNVTWLPRVTVMFFVLTVLFAIVIVGVLVSPLPVGGVGDGDVPPLIEVPPHDAVPNANVPAVANP